MARGKVLIIYKSGAQVEVECDNCTIRKSGGTLTSIALEEAMPRPLLTGLNEIAAVYDLGDLPDALG